MHMQALKIFLFVNVVANAVATADDNDNAAGVVTIRISSIHIEMLHFD